MEKTGEKKSRFKAPSACGTASISGMEAAVNTRWPVLSRSRSASPRRILDWSLAMRITMGRCFNQCSKGLLPELVPGKQHGIWLA